MVENDILRRKIQDTIFGNPGEMGPKTEDPHLGLLPDGQSL